jgi:NADH:ubiquinone oxidoreductase subunit 6 (subunit J)
MFSGDFFLYILFLVFSSLTIISSFLVITAVNSMYSVFSLIFVFFNSTALLLLLEVEFISIILLIVYVGAIAVLFLFVVMLLSLKNIEKPNGLFFSNLVAFFLGFFFILLVLSLMINLFFDVNFSVNFFKNYLYTTLSLDYFFFNLVEYFEPITNLERIGQVLYTTYFYFFILSGFVLLVAMIGVIVLTLTDKSKSKKQLIYKQVYRNYNFGIKKNK